MSNYDMASYLRITAQEIDSLFTYLMHKDIIYRKGSQFHLLNTDRLGKIAQKKPE